MLCRRAGLCRVLRIFPVKSIRASPVEAFGGDCTALHPTLLRDDPAEDARNIPLNAGILERALGKRCRSLCRSLDLQRQEWGGFCRHGPTRRL
jgi:hypothetical protein